MARRRFGQFAGGIVLPDENQATLHSPVAPWCEVECLRVPLSAGGAAAKAVVAPGQSVSAGEKIAEAGGAAAVFAPLDGNVVGLTTADVAGAENFVTVPAVELSDLVCPTMPQAPEEPFDWRAASSATLRDRLTGGGLMMHRRPAEPLDRWIQRARDAQCRTVILNGIDTQPYVTADHRLMVEFPEQVIGGLTILARAVEARELVAAVDESRTEAYARLVEPAKQFSINRLALPHKYPVEAPAVLVKMITRREMPPGGNTLDVGSAVVDAATCVAAFRRVAWDMPSTGRVVTVSGEHAGRRGNFWIPFGLPCRVATGSDAPQIVHGGPMTGLAVTPDAVVGPTTDAILSIDAPDVALPGPCIRCSWCTEHCPARLNVSALNDAFELGQVDRARKLGAMACVECGVCTYLCPARLPLSHRVVALKRAIVSAPVKENE